MDGIDGLFDLFGFDNVFIFDYDSFKTNKEYILLQLCLFMDVDIPKYKDVYVNKSINGFQLECVRVFNYFTNYIRKWLVTFFTN